MNPRSPLPLLAAALMATLPMDTIESAAPTPSPLPPPRIPASRDVERIMVAPPRPNNTSREEARRRRHQERRKP